MKLTSNYNGKAYWRTFNRTDTVYIIGLKEGLLADGESMTYENPTGFFQMEVKRDGIFGKVLSGAGHVYSNDDEFLVMVDGSVQSIEDAAVVAVDTGKGFQFEFCGSVVQFFSAGAADSTITITSSLTQTVTTTNGVEGTIASSATDETDTTVGGEVSSPSGSNSVGVKVNGSVSSKVTNKIEDTLKSTLNVQVATATTYSEQQQITLKAEKLTVIRTSWQRRFVTGTVTIGPTTFDYDGTLGYLSSRQISEFDSPTDLPPDLLAAYQQQNPGHLPPVDLADGTLMREQSTAPVYVIFGGAKFWVPSPDVLQRLYGGWAGVRIVADDALAVVPSVPREGTLLREEHNDSVWQIRGGQRCHVTTPAVLQSLGGWAAVHIVPDGATASISEGQPIV